MQTAEDDTVEIPKDKPLKSKKQAVVKTTERPSRKSKIGDDPKRKETGPVEEVTNPKKAKKGRSSRKEDPKNEETPADKRK